MSDLVAQPGGSTRASDADRDRVLKLLTTATSDGRLTMDEHGDLMARTLGARTLGELVVITQDLASEPEHPVASSSPPAARRGMLAVFGARTRKGAWQVPAELHVSAVFGAIELDFRDAQFDAPEVVIVANSVFGAVELTVPHWVRVEDEGHVIFGARDFHESKGARTGSTPHRATIRLRGVTVFGAVEVKRKAARVRERPSSAELNE